MSHRSSNRRRSSRGRTAAQSAETCEERQMLSAVTGTGEVASVDGTGNNIENPDWGSAHIELLRLSAAEYADGISSPAGEDRANARDVSNAIADQAESIVNSRGLSDFVWMWGQFLDHDIDLTEGADPAEEFNIDVPTGDIFFDPFGTGQVEISLNRSIYVEGEESSDGIRQQINEITSFIDGSVVYGSDAERAAALRTFEGGKLKTSEGDLLPFNTEGLANAGGTSDALFLAGDVRANENAALASMHTLFVREHNRLADEIAAADPTLTDEEIYQEARAIVRAQLQVITYEEFLPALLGPDAIAEYNGYDATVDSSISTEFSTAAYRFGHTLLSPELQRLDENGEVIEAGNLALQAAFFNPANVTEHGIDSLLRGAATQAAQELDSQLVDDVRNFLFGPPGAGGLDLASLNIQRGRDHGLADYNQVRTDLGLPPVTSFSDITSDAELAAALEEVYGDVNEIDLWVGGLAEDHLSGTSMGATFTAILTDQFTRLRDGDRFWYENVLSGETLESVSATRLSDIIERNSDVTGLQTNVFFVEGTEPVDVKLSSEQVQHADIRTQNGMVQVVNQDSGEVLMERPLSEIGSLTVRGGEGIHDHIRLRGEALLALGSDRLRIDGGGGAGDSLTVQGTNADDTLTLHQDRITLNATDALFAGFEEVLLEGGSGNDLLDAANVDNLQITLDGESGNDRLIGSRQADVLLGGAGNDVILAGDGDDQVFGGEGNDRLYGERGRDRMLGNAGVDMLVDRGSETSPENVRAAADFLNGLENLRLTANDFLNWGGKNERWLIGDNGWLFITPDGALYEWNRSTGAEGNVVAQLTPEFYSSLELLTAGDPNIGDQERPDAELRTTQDYFRNLQLRDTGNLFENWGGRNERWMLGSSGWYFLTPDGRLYHWDGGRMATGTLLADLGSNAYQSLTNQ